jgi:hypothetical protein
MVPLFHAIGPKNLVLRASLLRMLDRTCCESVDSSKSQPSVAKRPSTSTYAYLHRTVLRLSSSSLLAISLSSRYGSKSYLLSTCSIFAMSFFWSNLKGLLRLESISGLVVCGSITFAISMYTDTHLGMQSLYRPRSKASHLRKAISNTIIRGYRWGISDSVKRDKDRRPSRDYPWGSSTSSTKEFLPRYRYGLLSLTLQFQCRQ